LPIRLSAGDLVLLPGGDAHSLSDAAELQSITLEELIESHPLDDEQTMRAGRDGELTRLLCGGFMLADFPEAAAARLPEMLFVAAGSTTISSWLEPALTALSAQAAQGVPGTHAVQSKIAEVFLVEALRAWLLEVTDAGVVDGSPVDDREVARTIELISRRFAERWTLATLASQVGLSRTALVDHFRRALGDSPIHYLTRIRLAHAATLLATTALGHHEIARLSGYATEAALARAFKRERGETPGAHRAAARRSPRVDVAELVSQG
jgi:AraC-like DNA-binding protein